MSANPSVTLSPRAIEEFLKEKEIFLSDTDLLELIKLAKITGIMELTKRVNYHRHLQIRDDYRELLKTGKKHFEIKNELAEKYYTSTHNIREIAMKYGAYKPNKHKKKRKSCRK